MDLASRALREEDGEFEFSIANSVWGQEGRRVRLAMPKFKLETGTDLADVLARMGMTNAFDERRAEFQGISDFSCLKGDDECLSQHQCPHRHPVPRWNPLWSQNP